MLINKDLGNLSLFIVGYLDDIIINSNEWEEHLNHIRAVFNQLRNAGLLVKPQKYQVGMSECVCSDHAV